MPAGALAGAGCWLLTEFGLATWLAALPRIAAQPTRPLMSATTATLIPISQFRSR